MFIMTYRGAAARRAMALAPPCPALLRWGPGLGSLPGSLSDSVVGRPTDSVSTRYTRNVQKYIRYTKYTKYIKITKFTKYELWNLFK